jgi:N-acetylneuraminic acid mutarotase
MPTIRNDFAAVVVDEIVYAIGGLSASGYLNTVEAYNPQTNNWTTKAAMPTARYAFAAAAADEVVYAIGGLNGDYSVFDLSSVEAYLPSDVPAMNC